MKGEDENEKHHQICKWRGRGLCVKQSISLVRTIPLVSSIANQRCLADYKYKFIIWWKKEGAKTFFFFVLFKR